MATSRAEATGSQTAEDLGNDVTAQLERVDTELRAFVKERPVMALLGAVAAGYMIGRILRRVA